MAMQISAEQRTTEELEQGLAEVLASPRDVGCLHAIFVRPGVDRRQSVTEISLTVDEGIAGDRWAENHWRQLPDGRSDPSGQVSLMNARILQQISGGDREAMSLAGDNLIVDFDLSEENLPAGTRLRVGESVVLEITELAHTACKKFAQRFGADATKFINSSRGRQINLRGRFARVVIAGTIQAGDPIVKL